MLQACMRHAQLFYRRRHTRVSIPDGATTVGPTLACERLNTGMAVTLDTAPRSQPIRHSKFNRMCDGRTMNAIEKHIFGVLDMRNDKAMNLANGDVDCAAPLHIIYNYAARSFLAQIWCCIRIAFIVPDDQFIVADSSMI